MTDKMREEFEAAYVEDMVRIMGESIRRRAIDNTRFLMQNGEFQDPALRLAFWAWQASRASLVIELPKIINKDWACDASECEFMRGGINLTRLAILKTGVKVKL